MEKQFHAAKAEGAWAVVNAAAKLMTILPPEISYVPSTRFGDGYVDAAFFEADIFAVNAAIANLNVAIAKLRAAQPQPTNAAPATVRHGDEVLRTCIEKLRGDDGRFDDVAMGRLRIAVLELLNRALEAR